MNDHSEPTRVNIQELLLRVEHDRDLLNELLSIFVEEFPQKLQQLKEAVAREHLPDVLILSHALKGMLANLSVTQAAVTAANLERLARGGQIPLLKQALSSFEQQTKGLVRELQAQLAEARP